MDAPDALRYAFSKDLLGIYPELKRAPKSEEFNKNFNEKGEFIPPKVTTDHIFNLKDKKNRAKPKADKDPTDAFAYEPKHDPWVPLEDW